MTQAQNQAQAHEFDFRLEFADSDTTPLLHVSAVDSEFLSLRDLVGEPVSITLSDTVVPLPAKLPRL